MIKKRKTIILLGGLFLPLFFSIIFSIMVGAVYLPFELVTKILLYRIPIFHFNHTWTTGQESIIWNLRMPRIFLAIIVGAVLSISGVAFQGVLRNPLADPYILGISSGAALGATMTFLFVPVKWMFGYFTLPLFAFLGGIFALGFVIFLNGKVSENNTIILTGVIAQSLFGAILSFLISISNQKMQMIIFWMMGSLANHDWIDVFILLPYLAIGGIYLLFQYRDLNLLSLGESSATHLGMDVEKKKMQILIMASLLAASVVSIVGIIGFVGLIVPHMIRIVTGPDHRILLPVSILAGGIFLLWADTLARTMVPSREVPIGVITAFVGAPFFAYLLRKALRRGEG